MNRSSRCRSRSWSFVLSCAVGAAWASPAEGHAADVEGLLQEARGLTRQLRLTAAEVRLRDALASTASVEQRAYAHLLLGIVQHERRDVTAAELSYREVLNGSSDAGTRAAAQANLDLLAEERTRSAEYATLQRRLDRWLVIELAVALLVAAGIVRISR